MQNLAVFWFRRDLRLHDNAGLYLALSSGSPVLPIFIFDSTILNDLQDKDDRRVSFIYAALTNLQKQLVQVGSTLDVRYGNPIEIFSKLVQEYSITSIYTNHDYEPYARKRDEQIQQLVQQKGISFYSFKDQVIFEKSEVVKDDGEPYMVYTPYSKKWRSLLTEEKFTSYETKNLLQHCYKQNPLPLISLKEMGFIFNEDIPLLKDADETIIQHYDQTRDIPGVHGTSRLGIHLRFGTISIRQLVQKALRLNDAFLRELIWREFFMQLLWHQPRVVNEACKKEYDAIQWRNNKQEFERWCNGETGVPIVDAGMRELNETGFMHNRVRMIVGSFLVKNLLIDWRWGEAYFARKLLDFELASNNGNWQWVAGCGCDAAPYFRIFNPDAQTKKFDPEFKYIKRWVPEWESLTYPKPIVDQQYARDRCLKAYKKALGKELA
ncbi:MAG: deoxyribodipyrimidine photolyase [Chitinophagaceae bacterium]